MSSQPNQLQVDIYKRIGKENVSSKRFRYSFAFIK